MKIINENHLYCSFCKLNLIPCLSSNLKDEEDEYYCYECGFLIECCNKEIVCINFITNETSYHIDFYLENIYLISNKKYEEIDWIDFSLCSNVNEIVSLVMKTFELKQFL